MERMGNTLNPEATPQPASQPVVQTQTPSPEQPSEKKGFKFPLKIVLIILVIKIAIGGLIYLGYVYILPQLQKQAAPATAQDILNDATNPFSEDVTFSNPFEEDSVSSDEYQNPFDEF
ncbi:hypothetical protein CMO96_04770 [Candidatus Woesebacteria bacterium]|nr:hypothetical protein [Candidatus Woesebacteria bacterium]